MKSYIWDAFSIIKCYHLEKNNTGFKVTYREVFKINFSSFFIQPGNIKFDKTIQGFKDWEHESNLYTQTQKGSQFSDLYLVLPFIKTFFQLSLYFSFKYLFIWLRRVLVAACRIFIAACGIFVVTCGIFSCSMRHLLELSLYSDTEINMSISFIIIIINGRYLLNTCFVRHHAKHFYIHYMSSSQYFCKIGINCPILQMEKLRIREVQ